MYDNDIITEFILERHCYDVLRRMALRYTENRYRDLKDFDLTHEALLQLDDGAFGQIALQLFGAGYPLLRNFVVYVKANENELIIEATNTGYSGEFKSNFKEIVEIIKTEK